MPSFYIKTNGDYHRVKHCETTYIEGLKNYICIHSHPAKNKKQIIHCTLKQAEEQLPGGFFFRIHKSYIISLEQIDLFNREIVHLEDGTELPISRQYYEALKARLNIINGDKKTKKPKGIKVNGTVILKNEE